MRPCSTNSFYQKNPNYEILTKSMGPFLRKKLQTHAVGTITQYTTHMQLLLS